MKISHTLTNKQTKTEKKETIDVVTLTTKANNYSI